MFTGILLLGALASQDTVIVSDMHNQTLSTHSGCTTLYYSLVPGDPENSVLYADCEKTKISPAKLSPARYYTPVRSLGLNDHALYGCNLISTWVENSNTTYAFQCFQEEVQ